MGDALLRDIRYACRQLRRSPGFTLVAVLPLGLGVGVNTAMYSLVDGLLLRPLPVERPDRLVDMFTPGGDGERYRGSRAPLLVPDFLDLKARNEVFSDMLAFSPAFAALNLGDRLQGRMALGSGRAQVLRLVLSQGLVLTASGLAAGLALAAGVARLLGPVLFGIGAADPVACTGALGVLLAAALAANVVPARRAARVDPAVAIRTE